MKKVIVSIALVAAILAGMAMIDFVKTTMQKQMQESLEQVFSISDIAF